MEYMSVVLGHQGHIRVDHDAASGGVSRCDCSDCSIAPQPHLGNHEGTTASAGLRGSSKAKTGVRRRGTEWLQRCLLQNVREQLEEPIMAGTARPWMPKTRYRGGRVFSNVPVSRSYLTNDG